MLNNEAAQNIVLNADFLMLLKQSPVDRLEWSSLLNLSEQEEECIDESVEPGDGLLIAGAARIPIRGKLLRAKQARSRFELNRLSRRGRLNRVQIKRRLFERYIDSTDAI